MYESEDEALKEIYRWNRSKVFQVFSNLDKLIEKYNQDTQGLDINEYIDYIKKLKQTILLLLLSLLPVHKYQNNQLLPFVESLWLPI